MLLIWALRSSVEHYAPHTLSSPNLTYPCCNYSFFTHSYINSSITHLASPLPFSSVIHHTYHYVSSTSCSWLIFAHANIMLPSLTFVPVVTHAITALTLAFIVYHSCCLHSYLHSCCYIHICIHAAIGCHHSFFTHTCTHAATTHSCASSLH